MSINEKGVLVLALCFCLLPFLAKGNFRNTIQKCLGDSLEVMTSNSELNKSPVIYSFVIRLDDWTTFDSSTLISITFPSEYQSILPATPECDDGNTPLSCSFTGRILTISGYFQAGESERTITFRMTNAWNPSKTGPTSAFSGSISGTTISVTGAYLTITEGQGNIEL